MSAGFHEKLAAFGLMDLGQFDAQQDPDLDHDGTVMMIGPAADFWPVFAASSEYGDGQRDPLNRWTERVCHALAKGENCGVIFPHHGPPFPNFLYWAQLTGRAWASPLGMLVHAEHGLMVSYRAAFLLGHAPQPAPVFTHPCTACEKQPCRTTCPVDAFNQGAYDVSACHGHLDDAAGMACVDGGCAARRACPLSSNVIRPKAQNRLHMRAFRGTK